MMKQINKTWLVLLFVFTMLVVANKPVTFAQGSADYTEQANILNELGLFSGTNIGYELERAPKRVEVAAMLVKFLGAESEANAMKYAHPFTDVPSWADAIVGYMYEKGLTKGVGNNLFGSSSPATAKDYTVFVLKALGYDMTDFSYADTMSFAVQKGLVSSSEKSMLESVKFTRGEMVFLSYQSLFTDIKGGTSTLGDKLGKSDIPKVTVSGTASFKFTVSGGSVTVQVDKATLPESMRGFSMMLVKSLNGASLSEMETLVHSDVYFKLSKPTAYVSDFKYDNFDGAYIVLMDKSGNVLGYTGYKGKAVSGTQNLVVKSLGLGAPLVPQIKTGITLNGDGTASVNVAQLPDYARSFKRILVKTAYFNGPGMINYEIWQNKWSTVNNYENGKFTVYDGKGVLNYGVRAYFYDGNNTCIGYKAFSLEEIIAMMKKTLEQNGVIDINSGIVYRKTDTLLVVPLMHELEKVMNAPYYIGIGSIEDNFNPISIAYNSFVSPQQSDQIISYQGVRTNSYPTDKGRQVVLTIYDKNYKLLGYHVITVDDLSNGEAYFKSATIKLAKPISQSEGFLGFNSEYYINGVKQLNTYNSTVNSAIFYNNGTASEINVFDFILIPDVGMEVKFVTKQENVIVESVELVK